MIKKTLLSFFTVGMTLLVFFLILDQLFPLDLKSIHKPQSTQIYDREEELVTIRRSSDGYYRFAATKTEIPPLLKASLLQFEDRYFYSHPGFNPVALVKALWHNLFFNRKIGASTITMQVARMMQRKERTLWNKLGEIFTALQLEWHFTKDEILTFYFNLAPYGGNIDGIKTAAWFYYRKPLQALSIGEIAVLTTIPKNPNANRPDRASNLYVKRLRVLRILLKEKLITKEQFERAFKEPLTQKRFPIPFRAPHFCMHLDNQGSVTSSLDSQMQQMLQKNLRRHLTKLREKNLRNTAAVIIHNPTMQVRAYIGSHRFFDQKILGQNNGVTMIRSPGSALKPFIYAKALDRGLITPKRELFDLPLHLKGYDPKNYDGRFEGIVTAEQALQSSLNIPAVELNRLLKEESLYELLQQAGIKSVDQPKLHYGDSIALGGMGISLLDLAHLYTAFANKGVLKSLGFTAEHKSRPLTRLFSSEAAYITDEILSDAVRPEFSAYWESAQKPVRIAFKTGTSARAKDLYTVGVTPEYTVAVWMGNFSGEPTKELTGIHSASPLLFDIFKQLSHIQTLTWFTKPPKVTVAKVCSDPIIYGRCRQPLSDYTIEGVTLKRPCETLRAEVVTYLLSHRGITKEQMLAHPCYETWNRMPPLIASLYDGQVRILDRHMPRRESKTMLKCYTFKQNPTVTWLIDGRLPIQSRSGEPLYYLLEEGRHKIACMDSASAISEAQVTILKE